MMITNVSVRRARMYLGAAILAGAATHLLFRHASLGLNLFVWVVCVASACAAFLKTGPTSMRAVVGVAACAVVAFAPVLRASDWALGWALPSLWIMLALLPGIVRDDVPLSDVLRSPFGVVANAPRAVLEAARLPAWTIPSSTFGKLAVGALLGAPFSIAFVLLLSFDSDFVATLTRAYDHTSTAASIAICTCFWAVLLGVSFLGVTRWKRVREEALLQERTPPPYRGPTDAPPAIVARANDPHISALAWSLALGQVVLVLGVYVAVSARSGFAGHAAVREHGVTYASYLHAGVIQLLMVATLSVGLVAGGHFLMRRASFVGPAPAWHARMAVLECVLCALAAATLASCIVRLRVYEAAYGVTLERLGVLVVAITVGVVLALTAFKSARAKWRGYTSTVALSIAGAMALAAYFNADAFVVEQNLARATVDTDYLMSLSSDACAAIDHPRLASDPALRRALAESWSSDHPGIRSYRGLTAPKCSISRPGS